MSALPGFLARNWTLKLSAFGIALLLWVTVRVGDTSRQSLDGVPVRVDVTDPQWALLEDPVPATATVRFSGPSRELMRMGFNHPSIVIPVDRVDATDTTVILRNAFVRQDRPGVIVEAIQPETVRLVFEPVRRMDLPVSMRFSGEFPDEMALAALPRAVPADVRVIGPQSRILPLDSVALRPLERGEVGESGRFPVRVDTTGLGGVQVQPLQVEVELVLEERVERVLGGIPVVIERDGWEAEFEMVPLVASVTISGARSLVEGLLPQGVRLVVQEGNENLPEEPGEIRNLPVRLEGVPELLRGEPEIETVSIRRPDDGGTSP